MAKMKINLTYDSPSVLNIPVTRNIQRCVEAVLREEHITAPMEINILVTDDKGIHAINKAAVQYLLCLQLEHRYHKVLQLSFQSCLL